MPTQTPPNGAALPQGGPPPSNPPSTPTPTTNVSRVANAAQMATAVPLTIESFLAMVANTPQTQQNAAMAISPAQLAHLSAMWQASQVPATPPMMRPYHPPPPLNVTPARASQNATAVASIDGDIWERENDIIPPPELILGGGRTMDTQLGTGNFDKVVSSLWSRPKSNFREDFCWRCVVTQPGAAIEEGLHQKKIGNETIVVL